MCAIAGAMISQTVHRKFCPWRRVFIVLVTGILLVSMTGCGKRGDPYRPSEAPSASSNRY
ncbi:MAG: hypothetical protein MJE68_24530 [Proteobacteria bacterium]|nr:hypothetical protein [Pseudomonadota bacterium]